MAIQTVVDVKPCPFCGTKEADLYIGAMEATAYASHEDSVGYRVCCQVPSYLPHTKGCYLRAALAKDIL